MGFLKNTSRRGWRYTGAIMFNRLIPQWLFRCRRFVIYRLEPATTFTNNSEINVSWCEIDSELENVERVTYFQRQTASGPVRAVQAIVDGELQGGFWMATQSFDESELGIRILLQPSQSWLFAAMVSKQMRGRGIYSNLLSYITSQLSEEGFRDLLVAVNPDNKPSNYVHQKHSQSCVGKVFAVRCLNWAWCFSSKEISRHGSFSSNAKARPITFEVVPKQT